MREGGSEGAREGGIKRGREGAGEEKREDRVDIFATGKRRNIVLHCW